jgi:hypothetical protein
VTTQIQYDPVVGAAALATFGGAKGNLAYLSGQNLKAGLLASLYSAEALAATAGVVPWFDLGNGEKGVAVLGGARDKLASAPESVRTIYLAAHGAARQAQAHAREASSGVPLSQRTDGALATVQSIGAIPLVVVAVVTVIGVAGVVATAWFAKGVVERIVQTHADDLKASYAVDQASKLAMAQIAAGQPVDPGVYEVLKAAAKKEQDAPFTVPAWALVGATGIVVALFWPPISDAIKWSQMFIPPKPAKSPLRGGRTSGIFTTKGSA